MKAFTESFRHLDFKYHESETANPEKASLVKTTQNIEKRRPVPKRGNTFVCLPSPHGCVQYSASLTYFHALPEVSTSPDLVRYWAILTSHTGCPTITKLDWAMFSSPIIENWERPAEIATFTVSLFHKICWNVVVKNVLGFFVILQLTTRTTGLNLLFDR